MPEYVRLLLLEATHQATRNLTDLANAYRDSHAKIETAIRSINKQLRRTIKILNSPPFLQEQTDAEMVHQPTPGSDQSVPADP